MFENRKKCDSGYWFAWGVYADGAEINALFPNIYDGDREAEDRYQQSLYEWIESCHPDCIKEQVLLVDDRDVEAMLEDY